MSNTLKQLKRAKEIVDRYLARDSVFPRELRDCGRSDPVRQQGEVRKGERERGRKELLTT